MDGQLDLSDLLWLEVALGHMVITLVIPPQIQVNTWYKSPWTKVMTLKTATAKDERRSDK